MQEYFDQYAEEYVEETETEPAVKYVRPVEAIPSVESLEDIVKLLKEQRAKDVVVLTDPSAHSIVSSLIVCSPFNSRHGFALAETLRRATKSASGPGSQISKLSLRRHAGWFQVDIGRIQVNVMSEEVRERYDLEGLWAAGEEETEPEISLIPPPR